MSNLDQQIIWNELAVVDVDAAAAFYQGLFGWTIREDERETYLHFYQGDVTVAGLSKLEGGAPPHWRVYVGTDDIDAYAERAQSAGAQAITPQLDIPHTGKLHFFADPEGGVLAAFQPADAERESWGPSSTPGRFCWVELMCSDTSAMANFYSQVAGWDTLPMAVGDIDYTLLVKRGGGQQDAVGGLMQKQADGPTAWLPYVSVANVDESMRLAGDLGAQVIAPPMDVGDFGRCGVLMDPCGAVVAVYQAKQAC